MGLRRRWQPDAARRVRRDHQLQLRGGVAATHRRLGRAGGHLHHRCDRQHHRYQRLRRGRVRLQQGWAHDERHGERCDLCLRGERPRSALPQVRRRRDHALRLRRGRAPRREVRRCRPARAGDGVVRRHPRGDDPPERCLLRPRRSARRAEDGDAPERQRGDVALGRRAVRLHAARREPKRRWHVPLRPALPGAGGRSGNRPRAERLPRLQPRARPLRRERSDWARRWDQHLRLRRWESGECN